MLLKGKPIQIVTTKGWNSVYSHTEQLVYAGNALACLLKRPVDMLVFEMQDIGHMQIRAAGYLLGTDTRDETSVLMREKSQPIQPFWFKVDDYSDHFVGTFLLPEEY